MEAVADEVTGAVRAAAEAVAAATGADLRAHGLEHRVKQPASLARAIEAALADGDTVAEALADVGDRLRFTLVTGAEGYTGAVQAVLARLGGFGGGSAVDVKNFWAPGNRFLGLNATVTPPSGPAFEVQFPTQASLDVSARTHADYEVVRLGHTAAGATEVLPALGRILDANAAVGLGSALPVGAAEAFGAPKDTSAAAFVRKNPAGVAAYRSALADLGVDAATHLRSAGVTPATADHLAVLIEGDPDGARHPDLLGGPPRDPAAAEEPVRGPPGSARGPAVEPADGGLGDGAGGRGPGADPGVGRGHRPGEGGEPGAGRAPGPRAGDDAAGHLTAVAGALGGAPELVARVAGHDVVRVGPRLAVVGPDGPVDPDAALRQVADALAADPAQAELTRSLADGLRTGTVPYVQVGTGPDGVPVATERPTTPTWQPGQDETGVPRSTVEADRYTPPGPEDVAGLAAAHRAAQGRLVERIADWLGAVNPHYGDAPGRDGAQPARFNCGDSSRRLADAVQGVAVSPAHLDLRLGEGSEMWTWTGVRPEPLTAPDPGTDASGAPLPEDTSAFTEQAWAAVAEQLAGQPVGSVAVVGVDWSVAGEERGEGGGHWFNAVVGPDGLLWVDAQSASVGPWPPGYGDPIWNVEAAVRPPGGAWRGLDLDRPGTGNAGAAGDRAGADLAEQLRAPAAGGPLAGPAAGGRLGGAPGDPRTGDGDLRGAGRSGSARPVEPGAVGDRRAAGAGDRAGGLTPRAAGLPGDPGRGGSTYLVQQGS